MRAATRLRAGQEPLEATDSARTAIRLLCADRGEPVMFVQSDGVRSGSAPMCLPLDEFVVGDVDLLLGSIEGCPFYVDRRLDQSVHQDHVVLDVERGEVPKFSLPAGPNLRFVTRPGRRAVANPTRTVL